MKVIILAGGTGTRLWPWSRVNEPKQILPFLGKKTLLQQTYQRLRLGFSVLDILVVTGKNYTAEIKRQLPQLPAANLLLEPARRDSAGAIGLALARLIARDPKEIIITVHADHYVGEVKKYARLLRTAGLLAKANPEQTILMGIKPAYPETGYGYIELGKKFVQFKKRAIYRVRRFIEKPSLAVAERLIASGNCFWNPGYFAWRADHLWHLYKTHLPDNFSVLQKISAAGAKDWQARVDREFIKLKPISIDYGILEKVKSMLVIPADFSWADIGHWRSVQEMSKRDKDGNVVHGESLLIESVNNLILTKGRKFVAALGVRDLVVVETKDVILIANRDRSQEVKKIVEHLRSQKDWQKYL